MAAEAAMPSRPCPTLLLDYLVEPFAVICETCRARLKVRSASVIGEIHACPKCGSMVHILPPAGLPQAVLPPSPPAEATGPSDGAVAEADLPSITFVESASPPPAAPATTPIVLGAVGGAALLLIGGLVVGMWRGGEDRADDPAPVVAAVASSATVDPPAVGAEDATPADPPDVMSDPLVVDHSSESVDQTAPLPGPPALPELPGDDDELTESEKQPTEEGIAARLPSEGPNESSPVAPPAAESRREQVLKFDPLDFDPSQLSLAASASPDATPSTRSIPDDADAEAVLAAGRAEEEVADESLLPPPEGDLLLVVQLGPMPSELPPPHKVAHQLALPIESIEITEMPLVRFVEVLSDMADVPVTLDPVALELAGVSPRQAVSAHANDATLEQLLGDVLSKLRLEFVESEGQVTVAMVGAERRRAVDYDVRDLAGTGDARHVAELIERFVSPERWRTTLRAVPGGGVIEVDGTTLRIDDVQSVRHEALIFCERLRLARGLALRSRYPAALVSVEPSYERLAANLDQRTTFTILPWERLADVVRHWQDATGLTILVDWSALADIELTPSSPVACSAIDRTWEEVLDGILEPLGLAWWAVDGETLQITSRQALDKIRRIEFYPVSESLRDQFASDAALLESLESELRDRAGGARPEAEQLRMELDASSGRLIVLGSPDVHRYLTRRLSDLLN